MTLWKLILTKGNFGFQELRNAHSEQLMGIRREEEMEMSDDDSGDNPSKKLRVDDSGKYMQVLFY